MKTPMPGHDYTLRCPKCNNEINATWAKGIRNYSMQTIDVPYFMCPACRVIDINNTLVRKAISSWRRGLSSRKNAPSCKVVYEDLMKTLKYFRYYFCRTAGYKLARFKKIIL